MFPTFGAANPRGGAFSSLIGLLHSPRISALFARPSTQPAQIFATHTLREHHQGRIVPEIILCPDVLFILVVFPYYTRLLFDASLQSCSSILTTVLATHSFSDILSPWFPSRQPLPKPTTVVSQTKYCRRRSVGFARLLVWAKVSRTMSVLSST